MEDHAYNAITWEAEGEPRFQGRPVHIKNLSLKKKKKGLPNILTFIAISKCCPPVYFFKSVVA